MQGKAEDAGGLTPAKDGNAAMCALHPRAFARNSDDCYNYNRNTPVFTVQYKRLKPHCPHLFASNSLP